MKTTIILISCLFFIVQCQTITEDFESFTCGFQTCPLLCFGGQASCTEGAGDCYVAEPPISGCTWGLSGCSVPTTGNKSFGCNTDPCSNDVIFTPIIEQVTINLYDNDASTIDFLLAGTNVLSEPIPAPAACGDLLTYASPTVSGGFDEFRITNSFNTIDDITATLFSTTSGGDPHFYGRGFHFDLTAISEEDFNERGIANADQFLMINLIHTDNTIINAKVTTNFYTDAAYITEVGIVDILHDKTYSFITGASNWKGNDIDVLIDNQNVLSCQAKTQFADIIQFSDEMNSLDAVCSFAQASQRFTENDKLSTLFPSHDMSVYSMISMEMEDVTFHLSQHSGGIHPVTGEVHSQPRRFFDMNIIPKGIRPSGFLGTATDPTKNEARGVNAVNEFFFEHVLQTSDIHHVRS